MIASCDWLKDQLGCTVMPIHHQGKDSSKGMRGSSALDGAVDTALHVTRQNGVPGEDVVVLGTQYQKDGEEAAPMLFDLVKVEAIAGRPSLVPVLRTKAAPEKEKLTPQQRAALDVLIDMLPEGCSEVAESDWRQRCVDGRRVSASESAKTRREAFNTAFTALVRAGRVEAANGKVRLSGAVAGSEFAVQPVQMARREPAEPAGSRRNPADSVTARPGVTAEEAESPVGTPPSATPDARKSETNLGTTHAGGATADCSAVAIDRREWRPWRPGMPDASNIEFRIAPDGESLEWIESDILPGPTLAELRQ